MFSKNFEVKQEVLYLEDEAVQTLKALYGWQPTSIEDQIVTLLDYAFDQKTGFFFMLNNYYNQGYGTNEIILEIFNPQDRSFTLKDYIEYQRKFKNMDSIKIKLENKHSYSRIHFFSNYLVLLGFGVINIFNFSGKQLKTFKTNFNCTNIQSNYMISKISTSRKRKEHLEIRKIISKNTIGKSLKNFNILSNGFNSIIILDKNKKIILWNSSGSFQIYDLISGKKISEDAFKEINISGNVMNEDGATIMDIKVNKEETKLALIIPDKMEKILKVLIFNLVQEEKSLRIIENPIRKILLESSTLSELISNDKNEDKNENKAFLKERIIKSNWTNNIIENIFDRLSFEDSVNKFPGIKFSIFGNHPSFNTLEQNMVNNPSKPEIIDTIAAKSTGAASLGG